MANKKKPSEKQAFLAEQRKAKRKESEKAKRKKHRTKKTVTAIVCCAAAVAVVAGGTTWFVREKPMTQLLSAGKTAHYKLNAAEVSFYAWQIYNGYITSNSESGSSNVPDTSKPLADQNYDNDTTWEAYFTDAAEEYAKNILAFCEAADAENYTPEEDISSLVASAKKQIDFSTMPDTVKEENVTHALELYFKAQSFSTHIQDNFNFTEEELNAYYEKNPTEMDVCSYMEFSFSYDDSSDSTTISQSQAEELARNLRRCDTKESFEQWVHDYYAQNTSLTEEELASQVKTLCMEDVSYTQNDSISEWAFSADTKVGDSKLFTDTDNKTITVCLLNNYYLGMVRQMQQLFYGKRYSATCLRRRKGCPEHCKGPNESCPPYVPDFMKWAESYGAHGIRVTKEEDIIPALEAAKNNTDAPTVIEFMIATEEIVLPMVPGGNPMNNMILKSK